MHEMALARNLIREIEDCLAGLDEEVRVRRVLLQVGRLRAVVPEAMSLCFAVASEGSAAEGAELVIEEIPVRVRCGFLPSGRIH